MERKLRKAENNLRISGLAVIAFGVWSIIKFFFNLVLTPEIIFGASYFADMDEEYTTMIFVVIYFFFALDLLFRSIIGVNAYLEGIGRKRKSGYLVLACLSFILSAVSLNYFFSPDAYTYSITDAIISIIVECTSCFAMAELVISAFTIRVINRKMEAGKCS